MIEEDDENQPTSGADENEIRRAFAGVISAIFDSYPSSPACRRAVEEAISAHERIRKILETAQHGKSNGLTALWVETGLH